MVKWLKFIGLSFFKNGYAKQAKYRSFWNVLFQIFMFIIIVSLLFTASYSASFPTHYKNATEYQEFISNAFLNEDASKRVNLEVYTKDQTQYVKASVGNNTPNDNFAINTFLNEEDAKSYKVNGYDLVVDTRDIDSTYVKFTTKYTNTSDTNDVISEEAYNALSSDDKSKYTFGFDYTGEVVSLEDTSMNEYTSYFNSVSDLNSPSFNSSIANSYKNIIDNTETTQLEKNKSIYILYVNTLYPNMASVNTTGDAPCLRGYYISIYQDTDENGYAKYEKYLLILPNFNVGSFRSDNKIPSVYEGYYTSYKDGTIFDSNSTKNDLDNFVLKSFQSASIWNIVVYILNAFSYLPTLLVIILASCVLVFAMCRLTKQSFGYKLTDALKVTASFILFSSLVAGLLSFIYSFNCSRAVAYYYTMMSFLVIILIRVLVLMITEFVKFKKHPELAGVIEEQVTSSNDGKMSSI